MSAPARPSLAAKLERWLVPALIVIGSAVAFLQIGFTSKLISDEAAHCNQIEGITREPMYLNPDITMIPGYHHTILLLHWIFRVSLGDCHAEPPWKYRLLSMLISLPATLVFHAIARRLKPDRALPLTLQFHFLPILFPLFFVLYTDAYALCLALLVFYLTIRGRWNLAALAAIGAILVRQNNVVWVFCFWVLGFLELPGATSLAKVAGFVKKTALLLIVFALFVAFVFLNGGIAMGDRTAHPVVLRLDNVYFMLVVFGLVFLPANLARLAQALSRWKSHRWALVAVPLLYGFFLLTWIVDHKYNIPTPESGIPEQFRVELMTYFLRNRFLVWSVSSLGAKTVTFGLVLAGLLALAGARLRERRFYLLYLIAVLCVAPSWLVEQRYYLIPLALFLLMKEDTSKEGEYAAAGFNLAVAAALFHGIARGAFFL